MRGKKGFRAFVETFVEIANKTQGFGRVHHKDFGQKGRYGLVCRSWAKVGSMIGPSHECHAWHLLPKAPYSTNPSELGH